MFWELRTRKDYKLKVIAYEKPNGFVEILNPTNPKPLEMDEKEYFHNISNSIRPGHSYSIVELNEGFYSGISNLFRDAWKIHGDKISIDLEKAKLVWMKIVRDRRNILFSELDRRSLTALSRFNIFEVQKIEEVKQVLRDLPQIIKNQDISSLNQLTFIWHPLLGDKPI